MNDLSVWFKYALGCVAIAAVLVVAALAGYLFTGTQEIAVLAQIASIIGFFGLFCGILGLEEPRPKKTASNKSNESVHEGTEPEEVPTEE